MFFRYEVVDGSLFGFRLAVVWLVQVLLEVFYLQLEGAGDALMLQLECRFDDSLLLTEQADTATQIDWIECSPAREGPTRQILFYWHVERFE